MEGSGAAKGKASGDKPPAIVDHLTSQVVKDGDKVSLTCRIKGTNNQFKKYLMKTNYAH